MRLFSVLGVAHENNSALTQSGLGGAAAYTISRENLTRHDAYQEKMALAGAGHNATTDTEVVAYVGVVGAVATTSVPTPHDQNNGEVSQEGNTVDPSETVANGGSSSSV